MSTNVDRIVQDAVAKYQGLSPVAVKEIVETTAATVREDLLVEFRKFQATISPNSSAQPTVTEKPKNGSTKPAKAAKATKKATKKAAKANGQKKPRKPLSPEAKKNLIANLEKARAAKAEKAKKAAKANEARSAAMKKRWAEKKKSSKK